MPDESFSESATTASEKYSLSTDEAPGQQRATALQAPGVRPWLTYAALALAVIAAVLGALAYFHPAHNGAASTAQQSGDAKGNVCSAYAAAHRAVVVNTHLKSPNPDVQLAIAANARLALIGGGSYLDDRLAANTAAPSDLVSAAKSFSVTIQQLGINYMTESAPEVQNQIRKELDSQIATLDKLCA